MKNLFAAVALTLVTSTAVAQGVPGQKKNEPVQTYDFSVIVLDGTRTVPGCDYIPARKRTKFRNMIEVRANFHPEMNQSASSL
ncbi:MAG: hypothetical protein AB2A00_32960 [Myxococcota bacterium]